MKNKLLIILLILSFLGFVDATYLTIIHYKHIIPPCTITHGCETVLSSKFATIYGIPLALFGSVYFFTSVVLDILMFQNINNVWLRKIFALFNFSGLITSVILLSLQFFVLKALCQYCLVTDIDLLLLFYFSVLFLKRSKQREIIVDPERAVKTI